MKFDRDSDLRRAEGLDEPTSVKRAPRAEPAAKHEGERGQLDAFVWLYVTIAGSLLLRVSLLDFESRDYQLFLSRGYDFFVEHGRWHGLGVISEQCHASYPPLFLYLGATNWNQWVFERSPEVFWWPGVVLAMVATAFLALWMGDGPAPGLGEPRWLVALALVVQDLVRPRVSASGMTAAKVPGSP